MAQYAISVVAAGRGARAALRRPARRASSTSSRRTCRRSSPPRSSSSSSTRRSSPPSSRWSQGVGIWRYLVDDWLSEASTTGLMLGLSPIIVLAADYSPVLITLLFLPLFAIHRGGARRDREGAPGAPRRAHRPAQPRAVPRPRGAGDPRRAAVRARLHGDADGPQPLQGDQRHARPPPGRPAAAGGRDAAARRGASERHRRAARRRRVRRPAARRPTRRAPRRSPRRCSPACASRSWSTSTTLQVGGSIGLAGAPEHGDDVETLIQRADIAMYAAKATARLRGLRARQGHTTAAAGSRSPPRSPARSSAASSCSPTSPRPTCARAGSSAWRRSRAGSTPSSAASSRPSSSRSPSRPA